MKLSCDHTKDYNPYNFDLTPARLSLNKVRGLIDRGYTRRTSGANLTLLGFLHAVAIESPNEFETVLLEPIPEMETPSGCERGM